VTAGDPAAHAQALASAHAAVGLNREPPPSCPLATVTGGTPPRVVLSYGLGVDSTAILARWLTDPDSRDFGLDELVVLTSMTGQEWPATRELVELHLLPLLAANGVRYLQIARRGPVQADGVDILADSRHPNRLHTIGAWTLADELLRAGTVPQITGDRLCSAHFKSWPLDLVVGQLTQGRPYGHALGYSADELARARRDAQFNSVTRTGVYPLIDWGWSRADAHRFLHELFGVDWLKSACTYCVFALASKAGQATTVTRFVAEPEAGVLALIMEHTATALNPTQGLIKGTRLLTVLRESPGTGAVLGLFEQRLNAMPWAVFDVRRALSPRTDGQFNHSRDVRIVAAGSRTAMHDHLGDRAAHARTEITIGDPRFPDDQHPRVWLRHRDTTSRRGRLPSTGEQFFTIAPATATAKTGPAFPRAWTAASQLELAV
jgi:hypothetical protein